MHTHYDNLKVARNAPPLVIKAAYKALCQTYHPDKFQGSKEEAERIMKIISASYEALIDPAKRDIHNLWIKEQEAKASQQSEKPPIDETTEAPEQKTGQWQQTNHTPKENANEPTKLSDISWGMVTANFFGMLLITYMTYPVPAELKSQNALAYLLIRVGAPAFVAAIITGIFYLFRKDKERCLLKRSFVIASWVFLGLVVIGDRPRQNQQSPKAKDTVLSNDYSTTVKDTNYQNPNINQIEKERGIQVTNNCWQKIVLSLAYRNNNDWTTSGWWGADPFSSITIDLKTDYNKFYVYAKSDKYIWEAAKGSGYAKAISSSAYTYSTGNTLESSDSQVVNFLLYPASEKQDQIGSYYEIVLTCPTEQETHFSEIASVHPDYQTIENSETFVEWIRSRPKPLKLQYQNISKNGTSSEVVSMINEYKSYIYNKHLKATEQPQQSGVINFRWENKDKNGDVDKKVEIKGNFDAIGNEMGRARLESNDSPYFGRHEVTDDSDTKCEFKTVMTDEEIKRCQN
ncbi:MAG: DnaJ domain-containing protein [Methylococcaceae bacterium]